MERVVAALHHQRPATIGAGETLELASDYAGTITFLSDTGTLRLDHSAGFTGKVVGLGGQDKA